LTFWYDLAPHSWLAAQRIETLSAQAEAKPYRHHEYLVQRLESCQPGQMLRAMALCVADHGETTAGE
jgi:hypothetical protein